MVENRAEHSQPLISIITVVLNGERHLEQAIKSVLEQDYPEIEYIVVDGGSTDRTPGILKSYEKYISQWVSEKDEGIFDAMNKGIALAKGEIIGLLNSDDFYEKNILSEIARVMLQNQADIVYGNIRIVNKDGSDISVHKPAIEEMNRQPSVFHPCCFVRRQVYARLGGFDTRFKISSDYEFLLRCIRNKVKFVYLDAVTTNFRPGGMSASCASNIEGYTIMKMHQTGYHRQVVWRAIKCYVKTFFKKLLNLRTSL